MRPTCFLPLRLLACTAALFSPCSVLLSAPQESPSLTGPDPLPAAAAESAIRAGLIERIALPLTDGRINTGDFFAAIVENLGFDASEIRFLPSLSLDVQGTLGELKLDAIERITGGVLKFDATPSALTMTVDRIELRRRDKEIRTEFRTWMGRMFPDFAAAVDMQFGVKLLGSDGRSVALHAKNVSPDVVLLIHGLDDPGTVWTYLAPELVKQGYATCIFTYPNDQPIADSARLFATTLQDMRGLGVQRVSVVAHSMGGLVAREVLTNPAFMNGDGTGGDSYPAIPRLTLLGTPNQGSPMAYFHPVGEARDQIVRALSGDGLIFGSIFDGAGEAQIDLLPGSDFLTALNARPNPSHTKLTVIAGRASPVSDGDIPDLAARVASLWPTQKEADVAEKLSAALADLSAGVGDGCVSIASAQLRGADDVTIVDGNHLTMIRNYIIDRDRTPPCVPIILERLRDDGVPKRTAGE